jgi:DNA recombination protein RmuC
MEINQITLLIIVAVVALEIGAIVAYLIGNRQINRLRNKYSRLMVTLSFERKAAAQKEAAFQQATRNLKETFNSLAGNVLKENSAQFLHLAQENLKQFQVKAEGDLAQREKAVETLVKPIREALDKTESQIRMMEKERKEAHGSLTKHLETMADSHRLLQSETRHLVQALRRPEVRGQWGEMTLKRLAELAGMVEHCDFREQKSVQTDSGTQRPDMVIRMPDKREIVVDSKTPLDAYLAAVEASDDETRKQHLKRHAQNVRERVRELASKAYWEQFPRSPDFIVLFIPGDQFLSSALDMDRKLLEDALSDNVILATPTSLVALLRAIAYGWRQDALAENAEVIRVVGTEMFLRLTTFAEHLAKLGRSLDNSVETFNKAVGSFDSRVLPSARKFTELGITTRKKPPDLQQIERATRTVASSSETESTH